MISALNQKQMVFEALNNGAKHYIIKPIDPSILLTVINEVLTENNEVTAEKSINTVEAKPGFNIENINGIFIINFNNELGMKDLMPLETAIKGLLFIKPLSIVFDLEVFDNLTDQILLPILRIGKNIKNAEGTVEYRVKSEQLLIRIQEGEN
jgi:response regulator RpfG family c-di-GMP phosphodiesterase